ncbi:4-hydroxy-tetrahydrodipicolinate synthase [Achromobacter deleyi]|jgi:4-hydroxy-tetrahydrodipicolinate synthase|uniref:4-hydroxy-tetrahydrodipicolinate synthase n=1 Tax=Achromobacter TaxID=222 RepID=UPI000CFA92F6|nr:MULTISPECIES: 4-hydroxy-tetrahydrodipicolinate synthase [Achromobacter]MDR6602271.1 4-hydroxy-tetrahydrodipicolinate synthase [Achromobacter deleyi]PQZ58127.1 4-hydroxy-tetrahydrodipicolinate synthase [Achromobacter sp. MYb9]
MLNATHLRGVFPAIPTPVHADDTINVPAARALIAYLLKQGIDGIVPLGGTGEYGALPRAERIRMCKLTVEAVEGRVPVIPGVLDPGFHDALQAGREFAEAGADALMVLTPYYTTPTQAGIRDYFLRYADASPLPVMIYEIPYRTRIAIAPEVLHELSRHENIIGMKACNTDMYHFLRTVAGVDESFAVFSGEDTLLPVHLAAGARGGIVVTASLLPTAWRKVYALAAEGRTQESMALHRRLIPLMNLAFAETNPGPMKSVMDLIGVNAPEVLDPLVSPANDLQVALRAELGPLLKEFEGVV